MAKILSKNQLKLTALENRLSALDPRSVLNRGYSMTVNERTGHLVTDISQVQVDDRLTTELAKGQKIHSRVDEAVPFEQAEALFARAVEPRDLVIHPAANHAFVWHRPWLQDQLLGWLGGLNLLG